MKTLLFLIIVICASIVGFHRVLQNGEFLRYLDTHPEPLVVPQIEYAMGSSFALFHSLDQAATYYMRIPANYPTSPNAEEANWEYIQCLESMNAARDTLIEAYTTYMNRFPKGDHADAAQNRILTIQSGGQSRF